MDFLNLLGVIKAPTGLWAKLINWLDGGIGNYALVIIVLTLLTKVICLPLEFYNKYTSKKTMAKNIEMQPDIEKVNKLYANNPNMKNQKLAEVYKRHGFNIYGSCFSMLIYMVLTMVIFFTLLSSLNQMSDYKLYNEYKVLETTYTTVEAEAREEFDSLSLTDITVDKYASEKAEKAVVEKYNEIKTGFLWIKSLWRPDTSASVTLSYDNFIKRTKLTSEELSKEQYEKVINPIKTANGGWNGYFLLAVINGGLSFLNMVISDAVSKARAKKKGVPFTGMAQNKSLTIIMPIIMALFMIFYNSAFALYILTGSIFTCIWTPLGTLLVDALYEKSSKKNKKSNKPDYAR